MDGENHSHPDYLLGNENSTPSDKEKVSLSPEERIKEIRNRLWEALLKLGELSNANGIEPEQRKLKELEIDKLVRRALFHCDAQPYLEFSKSERNLIESLKKREIDDIGRTVSYAAHLVTSLDTRENLESGNLVNILNTNKLAPHRNFLSQFVVILEEFKKNSDLEKLLEIETLVRAYNMLKFDMTPARKACLDICVRFDRFFAFNLFDCVRGKGNIEIEKVIRLIHQASKRLYEMREKDSNSS